MQITRKAMSSIPENGAGAKKNKIVNRVVVKEARAYRIGHSYDVRDLTAKYQLVLQLAINLIWKNISWEPIQVQNYYYVPNTKEAVSLLKIQGKRFHIAGRRILVFYKAMRLIPRIPKSAEFMRKLRNRLLSYWKQTGYAAHYVDSAIRTAYWIMKSWKRNYINGRFGRKKPIVKKRFARIKTPYSESKTER